MDDKHKDENTDENNVSGLPEITFSSFILSLSSSALFHFGELPDPVTIKTEKYCDG